MLRPPIRQFLRTDCVAAAIADGEEVVEEEEEEVEVGMAEEEEGERRDE